MKIIVPRSRCCLVTHSPTSVAPADDARVGMLDQQGRQRVGGGRREPARAGRVAPEPSTQ
jgi:hypothetical protein